MFIQGLYFSRGILLHTLASTAQVQVLHGILKVFKEKHKYIEFIAHLSFVFSLFQSFHYSLCQECQQLPSFMFCHNPFKILFGEANRIQTERILYLVFIPSLPSHLMTRTIQGGKKKKRKAQTTMPHTQTHSCQRSEQVSIFQFCSTIFSRHSSIPWSLHMFFSPHSSGMSELVLLPPASVGQQPT